MQRKTKSDQYPVAFGTQALLVTRTHIGLPAGIPRRSIGFELRQQSIPGHSELVLIVDDKFINVRTKVWITQGRLAQLLQQVSGVSCVCYRLVAYCGHASCEKCSGNSAKDGETSNATGLLQHPAEHTTEREFFTFF